MKKIFFSALLAASVLGLKAQQDAAYSMYMFNGLYLNPAYAGSHEVVSLAAIYRHQWAGIDGAPRTFNASVHSPLRRDQYALGLTVSNDRLGLTNMFSATAAFAYRIRLKGDEHKLSFGIQAGFNYYQQRNTEAITDPAQPGGGTNYDPTFSVNQNLFLPNVGAGVYAYGKRYFVGFSVPHLVPFSLNKQWKVSTSEAVAHQYNHFLFTAGYVFGKETAIVKFKPTMLMKFQQGLRYNVPDFDFNANFLFLDRFWLGAGVKTGGDAYNRGLTTEKKFNAESVMGMFECKVTPQLRVGYAYVYSFTALRRYETGTHEIMVGYDFWYDKKRFVTPRYIKYF
ncbi:MAG: type IX secretion system membrane protein PorP/SprF [Chitinophagales bacterium]